MKANTFLIAAILCTTTAHAKCLSSEPKTAAISPSKIITGLYNNNKPIPGCLVYQEDKIIGYTPDQAICTLPLNKPVTLIFDTGCCDTIPYGDAECTSETKPPIPGVRANGIKLLLTPMDVVTNFYKPYLPESHIEYQNVPDSLSTISTYATYGLKQAIAKNEACEIREQGICNIDADIIINGQDYDLSTDVRLEETNPAKDRKIIRAHFTSSGQPNTVSYTFTKEGSAWKIDDVEAADYKADGIINSSWSLKKRLSQ